MSLCGRFAAPGAPGRRKHVGPKRAPARCWRQACSAALCISRAGARLQHKLAKWFFASRELCVRRLLALVTQGHTHLLPTSKHCRAGENRQPITRPASLAAAPGAGEQAPAIAEASALRGALAGEAATGACVPRHYPLSARTVGKLVVAPRGNGLAWVQLSALHSARLRPSLPCSTSRFRTYSVRC